MIVLNRKFTGDLKISVLLITIFSSVIPALATNYYVDNINGNDSNNGISASSPWQSLTNVNNTTFQPGDSILFHAGQNWTGTIIPIGSGTKETPIVIGRYGQGTNPRIDGDGLTNCTAKSGSEHYCTIYLYNQDYWIIRDLEITNYDNSEEDAMSLEAWEANNISSYANVIEPDPYEGENSRKSGILVEMNNKGPVNGLHFLHLEIHGVNGDISDKNNGGIYFEVFRFSPSDQPSFFSDLLIEDCHIHDVDRTGISNRSYFDDRELRVNSNWTPNQQYVIRNSVFERTGANALIVRVSDGAVIESCLFDHCSIKESGNAAFNFNTDGTLWQFNEFTATKANVDDEDAGGIDSDYRSKNTIIQYNYCHDNDFGMLVTGGPGRFNDSTIIRYNIFERDGRMARKGSDGKFALRFSGSATNTIFHNNVVYLSQDQRDTKIAFHKAWSGSSPNNTFYYNNIFYNEGTASSYDFRDSKNNLFSNNIFYGQVASNEPPDENKITLDPALSAPGNGKDGYLLQEGSSALKQGLRLNSTPETDYYGNSILANALIDIGIHQVSMDEPLSLSREINMSENVFPNPVVNGPLSITGIGQNTVITISDLQGTRILRKIVSGDHDLDLSPLHSGIYILTMTDSSGQAFTVRFLKI